MNVDCTEPALRAISSLVLTAIFVLSQLAGVFWNRILLSQARQGTLFACSTLVGAQIIHNETNEICLRGFNGRRCFGCGNFNGRELGGHLSLERIRS